MTRAHTTSVLAGIARNFANALRRYGTICALCGIADRWANRTLGLCVSHLFCFDLERSPNQNVDTRDFTFRFLTPDDIRLFAVDPLNDLRPEMACRVEAGDDLCFGVLAGSRLAGYGWCALRSIESEHTGGVALSFPPHVGYLYKGFTHPDFRGQGLNGIRLALASHALFQRGIRRLVCLVDWTNWASIQSCRRSACQELGRVVTFCLAGRRYWFMPDTARQLGICVANEEEARADRPISNAVAVA